MNTMGSNIVRTSKVLVLSKAGLKMSAWAAETCGHALLICSRVSLILMAHCDAREGKWRGNWRMEWVASPHTLPRNVVYPALLTLMRTPRLPAVDWTDDPADLNGLVHFGERRNLVSARVPSRFERIILTIVNYCRVWPKYIYFYSSEA
jgi:hypothetical protein